jgi:hypothetical protein
MRRDMTEWQEKHRYNGIDRIWQASMASRPGSAGNTLSSCPVILRVITLSLTIHLIVRYRKLHAQRPDAGLDQSGKQ